MEDNLIVVAAYPVKYHDIEYNDDYITVTQNMTRRRVPKGYFFEDTGTHIYISSFYADIFQHKWKRKRFLLNKNTKDWSVYEKTEISKHSAIMVKPIKDNIIKELKK